MAAKSDPKLSYTLLSMYDSLYTEKYGKKPIVNRYREKWGMQDVIDSIGFNRAKEVLEYYFLTSKNGHPIVWFFNNFDSLNRMMQQRAEDDEHRKKLRGLTRIMVEEMENEYRSSSN
jgi:hypothetical protein